MLQLWHAYFELGGAQGRPSGRVAPPPPGALLSSAGTSSAVSPLQCLLCPLASATVVGPTVWRGFWHSQRPGSRTCHGHSARRPGVGPVRICGNRRTLRWAEIDRTGARTNQMVLSRSQYRPGPLSTSFLCETLPCRAQCTGIRGTLRIRNGYGRLTNAQNAFCTFNH